MAVIRVAKIKNFTVMANYHLQDTALSLKAKGLLSLILSLPDNWDYSAKGLACICKEGVDSISATIKELEQNGYIIRHRVRNTKGHLTKVEYTILEKPKQMADEGAASKPEKSVAKTPKPKRPKPKKPVLASPVLEKPEPEKPRQLSTKELSTKELNTELINSGSSQSCQMNPFGEMAAKKKESDTRSAYRQILLQNISYDVISQDDSLNHDYLGQVVELLLSTVCFTGRTVSITGDDYPVDMVKARFMGLTSAHIRYVLDNINDNLVYIEDIRSYLMAALFNAPTTIGNYSSCSG